MPDTRIYSLYDWGNTDIVGAILGDSKMTNPLSNQYDNAAFCMLICGAS